MRLVTVRTEDGTRAARQDGDELVLLEAASVSALLAGDEAWASTAAGDGVGRVAAAGATLAAVVPTPEKIVCIGLNYGSHADEVGSPRPEYPTLFAKYWRALIGPQDPIVLPANSTKVDWEAELGIVIGRAARHVTEADALDHVAGYTVVNDISMRDWQGRTRQWLQGKTFEASTPVGPALVTADEVGSPDDLTVRCEVDGEVVQESSTSDLIFGPAALIAYISAIVTLAPGDLIVTGTPGGVGVARDPQRFLAAGATVRTTVSGVGELVNVCHAEADGAAA